MTDSNILPFRQPLSDYAVEAYSQPKVKKLCLYLQDRYHANVNILLWTYWLSKERIKLSAYFLDHVLISIDTLSQLTVGRLREARRVIKVSQEFEGKISREIQLQILRAEISAERILLARLEDITKEHLAADQGEPAQLLTPEYYLDFLGIDEAEKYASILTGYLKVDTFKFVD